MMSSGSLGRVMASLTLAIVLGGCATWPPGAGPTAPGATSTSAAPAPTAEADGTGALSAAVPPVVALHVEGGDPVAGRLGSYDWAGGGSDSPWLPGSPIRAVSGEMLAAIVSPDVRVLGWSALLAPASSADGVGAAGAGRGKGALAIAVPVAGSWTLAVTIDFGDLGSATYFWRLEVG
jgi:hypothetical protein